MKLWLLVLLAIISSAAHAAPGDTPNSPSYYYPYADMLNPPRSFIGPKVPVSHSEPDPVDQIWPWNSSAYDKTVRAYF